MVVAYTNNSSNYLLIDTVAAMVVLMLYCQVQVRVVTTPHQLANSKIIKSLQPSEQQHITSTIKVIVVLIVIIKI